VLAAWVLGYAVLRFTLELLRGDPERGVFLGLPPSQLLAAVAAGAALVFLRR
jgi:hypothetical protein